MNTHTSQKGSVKGWVIAVVVIVVLLAIYFVGRNSFQTQLTNCCHGEQYAVTIMIPADLDAYRTAEVAHVQEGTPLPSSIQFIATSSIPNTLSSDPLRNAAEAAAEYIPTQAGTSSLVVYFKVVNGTAYVVLSMDIDGWAGVSAAIAQVHPIVEKTLLAQPGITAVKFGPAPGDTIQEIMGKSAASSQATSTTTKVLSPNGGEVIDVSKGITVSFIGTKGAEYSINISDDSTDHAYNLDSLITFNSQPYKAHITATGLSQTFTVNAQGLSKFNLNPGSMYRIELCTPGPSDLICDYSDGEFTITN